MSDNNVWDSISNTTAEAEIFRTRSDLMMRINERIQHMGWSQTEAARYLRLTRPRVRELIAGQVDRFTVEDLIAIAVPLGIKGGTH